MTEVSQLFIVANHIAPVALLLLMLALTFSDAARRDDDRRDLIIREGQTISTVYQAVDLLKDTDQTALRTMLKDYLDLDYPRVGMINLDQSEQTLLVIRRGM
jgi:hypothetical protein